VSRRVDLVRTDVSEERITIIRVVPSSPILVALMMEALSSSETSVLTRATRRNIPEDTLRHIVIIYEVNVNKFAWIKHSRNEYICLCIN
jgi:hypothetical protein